MSEKQTCETCRFAHEPDPHNLMCRRYPPTPMYQVSFDGSGASHGDTLWPWVMKTDWCGEHAPLPQREGVSLPLFASRARVAEMLDIAPSTVDQYVRDGILPRQIYLTAMYLI